MVEASLKPRQHTHGDEDLHSWCDCSANCKSQQHRGTRNVRYPTTHNLVRVNTGLRSLPRLRLTLAIGLHISALIPIASISPAVENVTTWPVVCKSSLISLLAESRLVLEKHAASVLQLQAKTIIHFLHSGMLSYSMLARVSTRSSVFSGWETAASAVIGMPVGSGGTGIAFSGSVEAIVKNLS